MKKILFLTIFLAAQVYAIAQTLDTGWIDKGKYLEQKLKIDAINKVKYSKDGNYLYTFSSDKYLRKWDVKTGKVIYEKQITDNFIDIDFEKMDLYFTIFWPNDRYLCIKKRNIISDSVYYQSDTVSTNDYDDFTIAHFNNINLYLSQDGTKLISSGRWRKLQEPVYDNFRGKIDLWDANNGEHIYDISGNIKLFDKNAATIITDLAYSNNGNFISFSLTDYSSQTKYGTGYLHYSFVVMDNNFNFQFLKNEKNEVIDNVNVLFHEFSNDSKELVALLPDNIMYFWNISDYSLKIFWKTIDSVMLYVVKDFKYDKNSRFLITGTQKVDNNNTSNTGAVNIWHIKSGRMIYSVEIPGGDIGWCLDVSQCCSRFQRRIFKNIQATSTF